jgi:hypothetical protein
MRLTSNLEVKPIVRSNGVEIDYPEKKKLKINRLRID